MEHNSKSVAGRYGAGSLKQTEHGTFLSHYNTIRDSVRVSLVTAAAVVGAMVLVAVLSKSNEVRQGKLPITWRAKIRDTTENAREHVRLAEQSTSEMDALVHAVTAVHVIGTLHNLAGQEAVKNASHIHTDQLQKHAKSIAAKNGGRITKSLNMMYVQPSDKVFY